MRGQRVDRLVMAGAAGGMAGERQHGEAAECGEGEPAHGRPRGGHRRAHRDDQRHQNADHLHPGGLEVEHEAAQLHDECRVGEVQSGLRRELQHDADHRSRCPDRRG
jgi:hypothetical protein